MVLRFLSVEPDKKNTFLALVSTEQQGILGHRASYPAGSVILMVLSASPPFSPRTVSLLLDQTADELSQNQQVIRIKKLLLYICTATWENDPQHLDRHSLRVLLQCLFESFLSYEQLQNQLNQVAATLNKPAEYTIIANTIASHLQRVYAELQQGQSITTSPALYQSVAYSLEQEPEHLRIKKLLVLACRSTWENDRNRLAQLTHLDLVQELHQIAPTAESLRSTLSQIAKALSKPEEYSTIAAIIAERFQLLYQEEPTHLVTTLRQVPEATHPQLSPMGQTDPADLKTRTLLRVLKHEDRPALSNPSVPTPPTASVKPVLKVVTVAQPQKSTDLFDLRLEIMQDTNPLKAKILLFSLLHEPFQWQDEQESMLKAHELDELLRILFLSYRRYADVATQLKETAKLLSTDEYMQAAEAILRILHPFYGEDSSPIPLPDLDMELAEITNMKTDTREITLPDHH